MSFFTYLKISEIQHIFQFSYSVFLKKTFSSKSMACALYTITHCDELKINQENIIIINSKNLSNDAEINETIASFIHFFIHSTTFHQYYRCVNSSVFYKIVLFYQWQNVIKTKGKKVHKCFANCQTREETFHTFISSCIGRTQEMDPKIPVSSYHIRPFFTLWDQKFARIFEAVNYTEWNKCVLRELTEVIAVAPTMSVKFTRNDSDLYTCATIYWILCRC